MTTQTLTLADFLLARLDDREARLDAPAFVEVDSARGPGWGNRGDCPICGAYQFDGTEEVTEEAWYNHSDETHQRARVLTECASARRIVERCTPLADVQVRRQTRELAHDVLCALALPYADHADYRDEWRP